MLVVFETHERDRSNRGAGESAGQHGKEHLLFFHHVAFEFLLHRCEMLCQAPRAIGRRPVHVLDQACQTNQFGQLLAMTLVKALKDVLNQFRIAGSAPVPPFIWCTLKHLEPRRDRPRF